MSSKLKRLMKRTVGGAPCHLDYEMTLTNDDVASSPAIRSFAKSLLQSFMASSILPMAAAASDTAKLLLKSEEELVRGKLPSTDALATMWNEKGSDSSFQLSRLLSATSFDLKGGPFLIRDIIGKPYLELPCVASIPSGEGQPRSSNQLDFTLRTKLVPRKDLLLPAPEGGGRKKGNGLEFSAPDCRVDVDAAFPNRSGWAKNLIPEVVWLPIGSAGMVLPLGRGHIVRRIRVADGDGICRIQGRMRFFQVLRGESDAGGAKARTGGLLPGLPSKDD